MTDVAPLLEVSDLAVSFHPAGGECVQAVDGLSFSVFPGQTLAIVGESGCGKSVTALSIMGLVECPPGRIDRGSVRLGSESLDIRNERAMRRIRGRDVAMIFQEPMSSLNPVTTVGQQIVEAVRLHTDLGRRAAHARAAELLEEVGITDTRRAMNAYPHEFSGGMCQRAMTAMALACSPRVLLADEPTTALDVTVQAQILSLLRGIQQSRDMGMVLITHDLGIVAEVADVVCVMYAGRAVEYAPVDRLFERPLHPYTRGLLDSRPRLDARRRRLRTVSELVADPAVFAELPGHRLGVVPWWPEMTPPADVMPGRELIVLHEVEPERWVACWNTPYVAEHPSTTPSISTHGAPTS